MDIPVQTIFADNQNSANQKVEYVVLSRAELDALLAKRDAILRARHEDLLTQLAQQNAQLAELRALVGSLVKTSRYNQRRFNSVHDVVVGGKEPNSALLSDEVKRQQVLCGIRLYEPSKEYSKGTSFKKAARRVLNDSPLARKPGGYSPNQIDALARAIAREYKNPREISRGRIP